MLHEGRAVPGLLAAEGHKNLQFQQYHSRRNST
jgi:hypothetical protein